ncbi:MAG: hypothetical protein G01um101477_588 [Candidatus Doudnabacteria bacterium Gr01-1014_77]|uniref:Uncharacterized protein n=1 Tax=Candidatus Doudnabacteria bacterium Gr01-1014_77 TaxID=2017133 RepID=A0A554JA09_9BACT|nr:MAG: hypothetical protein G01um101477_588 [Candidatus Doudnabacteria bacterium Gr01-1014_77]
MNQIPRNLIRHLEWTHGQQTPEKKSGPRAKSTSPTPPKEQGQIILAGDLSKYIQVGIDGLHGNPVVISPFELEGYDNKDYNNTHTKLLNSGLYMPTPRIFTTHFKNVIDAFHEEKKLLYADGSEVPKTLVEEMYKHYTTDFKDIYGHGNSGAWTWLNARFVEGTGWHDLNLETVVGLEAGKKKKFEVHTVPLEKCVWDDGYVSLECNGQGLAKKKSRSQEYKQGKNMYFFHPQQNAVAGFVADSGGTGLVCYGDPANHDASLGVFGCAEGMREKIKETIK